MRARALGMFFVGVILISLPVWGQNFTGDDDALAPYLSTKTVLIARVDVTRLDADAISAWEINALKSTTTNAHYLEAGAKEISMQHELMKKWADGFVKSGGKRVYLVLDLNVLPLVPVLIVPVDGNAKTGNLINVMRYGDVSRPAKADSNENDNDTVCELVGDKVLLFGVKGSVASIRKMTVAPRPELLKTLANAGDGAVQAAIEPTGNLNQALVEIAGEDLPPELGGGKTADIVAAITRGSAGLELPPKASFNLAIHCANAEAAGMIKGRIDALLKMADEQMNQSKKPKDEIQILPSLAETLKPVVDGSDVKISLDTDTLNKRLEAPLALALMRGQDAAEGIQSMSNVRQILMGCIMYASDNHGAYPADLSVGVIGKYLGGEEAMKKLMTNPRDPERQPGYEYVKYVPPAGGNAPSDLIIIYEAGPEQRDNVIAGYADGHVELLKKDDFAKQLAATKAVEQGK